MSVIMSANHNDPTFGAITFTIWFRLEYFAVYASPLLLPPEAQDSLRGGAGFTFHDWTFTSKICAAFPSALQKRGKCEPEVLGAKASPT